MLACLLLSCCRADKYTCPQLDRLARDFLRGNFEKVVQFDGQPPNKVGLTSLNHTALVEILTDDNLELSSEVSLLHCITSLQYFYIGSWLQQAHLIRSSSTCALSLQCLPILMRANTEARWSQDGSLLATQAYCTCISNTQSTGQSAHQGCLAFALTFASFCCADASLQHHEAVQHSCFTQPSQ